MRKFLFPITLAVLVVAGFFLWRLRHPRLTNEQQVAAALDGICVAAEARSPRGVANYLAKDFKAGGMSKSEFQNSLAGGILQYRVINLGLTGTKNVVSGETATSDGRYKLTLKSEYDSPPEFQQGKFKLQWRKTDGQWLITSAEIENPLFH